MNKAALLITCLLLMPGCSSEADSRELADAAARDLVELNAAWKSLYDSGCYPEEATLQIESLILKKLLTIRAAEPQYSPERGAEVKGLCATLETVHISRFPCALEDEEVIDVTREFLDSIKDNVVSRAKELQKSVLAGISCAT